MGKESALNRFFKDKKGVEMTLNTVILAILVILVLVVLIGFFLGGTGKLKSTVGSIFKQTTAGTDITIALEQCESFCTQASGWSPTLQKSSPYCDYEFNLDRNNDGEADKDQTTGEYDVYKCSDSDSDIYTPCPDVSCGGDEAVVAGGGTGDIAAGG